MNLSMKYAAVVARKQDGGVRKRERTYQAASTPELMR
jgi:hypothetical protein